ncbi:hypothetical protein [Pseudomonas palleroniana]|uniref:Uncharacterized protein n=1 Tax=Pseudomonas palleroniana TaxID=191390 RepID=A0A6H9SAT3_9PSED|nr:hypothetical protein [Pseudomonas palleroniana]KAB0569225.1 hypothetical protein F7R03_06570 [Pseudomonas palleroniana]
MREAHPVVFSSDSMMLSELAAKRWIIHAGLQKLREKSGSTQVFRLRAESLSDTPEMAKQRYNYKKHGVTGR